MSFNHYLLLRSSRRLLCSSRSSSPCYSSPSKITFSCRSTSSFALRSSSRPNLSSRIASSGKDLGSLVFSVDFDFDIFGLNNCQATPHTIDIVSFSKGRVRNPLHPFLTSRANVNERYSYLSVHEKILVDKEKAKYCYLTFSMIFHFSAIIFHVYICESYATLDTDERQKSVRPLSDTQISLLSLTAIRSYHYASITFSLIFVMA